MISGVFGIHSLKMRIRSQGSSLKYLTQTSKTAPPTRSIASKPASSSAELIGRIMAVVIRVAHKH